MIFFLLSNCIIMSKFIKTELFPPSGRGAAPPLP